MKTLLAAALIGAGAAMTVSPPIAAESLTIERLVASPSLSGPSVQGLKLSPDGRRITYLQGKDSNANQLDLWEFNPETGERSLLVDSDLFLDGGEEVLSEEEKARRERNRSIAGKTGIVSYFWSEDGASVLVPVAGDIYVLPIGGEVQRLTNTPQFETDARFSPKGNYVSFIRDRELYVVDVASGEERKLTSGSSDTVTNGMAEFVAQEELSRYTGYWWAADESMIAYEQADESDVLLKDRYEIQPDGSVITRKQRYPAAGTNNATWKMGLVSPQGGETTWLEFDEGTDAHYLARVNWGKGDQTNRVFVQVLDRSQTKTAICQFDASSGQSQPCYRMESDVWINLDSNTVTLMDGTWIHASESSGYRHLHRVSDGEHHHLTHGDWVVNSVERVDEEAGMLYFTGYKDSPIEQHLYSVSLEGGEITKITQEEGWHSVTVGKGIFIDSFQSPTQPPMIAVKSLADGSTSSTILANALDDSHPYASYLDAHVGSEFGTLKADDGETDLYYRLLKPANFDPSRTYPAILAPYGGPHGQRVQKTWSIDFNQYMAQQGYVVLIVDNRGMWNRGLAFEGAIKNNMGRPEVDDQVAAAKWLVDQGYVDAERIGFWGWSYGGYMTLMAMSRAPEVFSAGASVAPVTDWRLYDTAYTERYLGHPDAPGNVYEDSSVFKYLDGLQGDLLVMHGMADDNVFFDNTVKLLSALQARRKPFELMTYPGKKHGIRGEDTRAHVWGQIANFFERTLK